MPAFFGGGAVEKEKINEKDGKKEAAYIGQARGKKIAEHDVDFLRAADGSQVAGISLIENTLTRFPGIRQLQLVQERELAVDVNLTSIHGLYRDRLASAFLIGADTRGDVDIDLDAIAFTSGGPAGFDQISVLCLFHLKAGFGVQAVGKRSRKHRRHVLDDKHGHGKVRRKLR